MFAELNGEPKVVCNITVVCSTRAICMKQIFGLTFFISKAVVIFVSLIFLPEFHLDFNFIYFNYRSSIIYTTCNIARS